MSIFFAGLAKLSPAKLVAGALFMYNPATIFKTLDGNILLAVFW